MAMKYAEAYVELAWKDDQFQAGERRLNASVRTIGTQTADMAAKLQAATKSTSADVYELQGSVYKLAETVADVPAPLEKVEERTLATGAALKNLGGVVGIVSPQMGGLITIAGALQARLNIVSQASGATATAAARLGTMFSGLSTTVLAFMGTPVGLMITGFTALIGLLAANREEGEGLGATLLRLTDSLHGLATAQEQANKETERGAELSRLLREEEQRRMDVKKDPGVANAEGNQARLLAERARLQQEINTAQSEEAELNRGITRDENGNPVAGNLGLIRRVKELEEQRKARQAELNQVEQSIKAQSPEVATAQEQARRNALASILPFDPNKSAAQNRSESEAKVRQREAAENREQAATAVKRDREMEAAEEAAAERRKQRDEERARKEKEREQKLEQEKARDRQARARLRGMGLDQSEREALGMSALFGNFADVGGTLASGADQQAKEKQRFGFANVADFASQIQQGIQQREEKEMLKKQTNDISNIAEGKAELKVRVVNQQPQVAVFGP